MKRTILAGVIICAFLTTACSGGSSSVTLHGTFTDTEYNSGSISPLPSTSAEWETDNLSGN